MTFFDQTIVLLYYGALLILSVFAVHRIHLVRLGRRLERDLDSSPPRSLETWPAVTVQLPLYNEPRVARRLIRAASRLEYPGRLSIQILDDSTDGTSEIVASEVAALSHRGIDVAHLRRLDRSGFKAGALAAGMLESSDELFAIFDADFVPGPDFLMRTIPRFSDARVGMVQARWGHLNRSESWLTRLQALYLDGHFGVESDSRHRGGLFFNFNGTAGVWRREAIEDAGGWSADTVTEDLDLSYRAQLAGWRFLFQSDHEVPAELPGMVSTFHGQQSRWARGSIQTARKLLGTILTRRDLPLRVRVEASFHLTNNSAYFFTLLLAVLLVPSVLIRLRSGWGSAVLLDFLLFFLSTASLIAFYCEGQRRMGRVRPGVLEIVSLVPFGIGLSFVNATAVVEGLVRRGGVFNRTPKRGDGSHAALESAPRFPMGETVMSVFFVVSALALIKSQIYLPLPFIALFLGGYLSVTIGSVIETFRFYGALKRVRPPKKTAALADLAGYS